MVTASRLMPSFGFTLRVQSSASSMCMLPDIVYVPGPNAWAITPPANREHTYLYTYTYSIRYNTLKYTTEGAHTIRPNM